MKKMIKNALSALKKGKTPTDEGTPTFSLSEQALMLNGTSIDLPIARQALEKHLGKSELFECEAHHIFIWHQHGIKAFTETKNETIHCIELEYDIDNNYPHTPKQVFSGDVFIDNTDAWAYYKNNPEKRTKLRLDDQTGVFIRGNKLLHFSIDELNLRSIGIYPHSPDEVKVTATLSEKYQYFKPLWQAWIIATQTLIPENNRFYNVTHGISDDDIKNFGHISDDMLLPDELVNFYKVHDVEFDFVTSAFQIATAGWHYSLIEFKDISSEWQGIQDLYFGDDIEDELLKGFSDKIKATDYANPNWIPFATGHNGDYLLFDTDPSEKGQFGQIIELENESWARRVVADSLKALIEQQINRINTGNTDYLEYVIEHNHNKF